MIDDSGQTLLTRLRLRRMELKERIQFCRRFGHFHAEDDLDDKLKDVEKQIRDREVHP